MRGEVFVELSKEGRQAEASLRNIRYQLRALLELEREAKTTLLRELNGADGAMVNGRPVLQVTSATRQRLDRKRAAEVPIYAELVAECSLHSDYNSLKLL